jgi:hypothetical protein
VIGSPLFSLCATRTSGLAKRIIENGASHAGAAGSPRAAKGKATTAMTAAAAIALLARLMVLDSLAVDFMLTVVCLRCPMSQKTRPVPNKCWPFSCRVCCNLFSSNFNGSPITPGNSMRHECDMEFIF